MAAVNFGRAGIQLQLDFQHIFELVQIFKSWYMIIASRFAERGFGKRFGHPVQLTGLLVVLYNWFTAFQNRAIGQAKAFNQAVARLQNRKIGFAQSGVQALLL